MPAFRSWRVCVLGAAGIALLAPRARGDPDGVARGLDPGRALTQLRLDTWSMDHGLPNATVNSVLRTRDGYVWLATYDGLARFDGTRFKVFTKEHGLGSNGVRALCEDREGTLWAGTNGGGLVKISRGRLTRMTMRDGLPSDFVRALHADDRDGSIWIGTNGGGLTRYHRGRFESFAPAQSGGTVVSIARTPEGAIWVAAQAEGVKRRAPDGSWTSYGVAEGVPPGLVTTLLARQDGTVWGGSSGGIFNLSARGAVALQASLDPLRSVAVSALLEDDYGSLWVGTSGLGLARYARGEVAFVPTRSGLGDIVFSLHLDRENGLWIGTNGAGFSRLQSGTFTPYTTAEGLSRDFTYTAFEDRAGNLWVGTASGLDRLRGDRFVPEALPLRRRTGVRSIAEDRDGNLWVGTYGEGLWVRRSGRWRNVGAREGLASENVRTLLVGRDGRLWVATLSGLSVLENGAWRTIRPRDGLPTASLMALAEDRDGSLWIGTDGGGLAVLRDGRFRRFTSRDGLAGDVVLSLAADGAGALWIGTNDGLSRLRGERFATLKRDSGLPSDSVPQIVFDETGDVWLGTSRGVARLPREIAGREDLFHEPLTDLETFDSRDGMKSSQCTAPGQPAGLRTRDGRLWFPTTVGIAVVDPKKIVRDVHPPPVVIEEATIGGSPVSVDRGIDVPPGRERLEIRYAVLSFTEARASTRFMLEGLDERWVLDAGDRRQAGYTGIPPGHYSFRVSSRARNGPWGPPVSVSVEAKPRFYETPAFLGAVAISLLGAVWVGLRFRVRNLVTRERRLAALVDARTRDLEEQTRRAMEARAESEQLHFARDQAEDELRRQGAYLASLHETALAVMDRLETAPLLRALVERARGLLGDPDGFVYLETPDRSRLSCEVWVGRRPKDQFAEPNEGAVGRAWQTGAPVAVDAYDVWDGRSSQVAPGLFGPMMAVPLRFAGSVRGALGVGRAPGSPAFAADEMRLLASFAQVASIALDNARLFGEARAEVRERTRAQAALQESEQRFRQLAEHIDVAFFIRGVEPRTILYISPGYERIWQRPAPATIESLLESVHPDDREKLAGAIRREADAGYDVEYRIVRPDGSIRWIRSRTFPVRDGGGRTIRMAGIAEDVTDVKAVERLRGDLTHTLVHDLRNPLGSVLASLEILESSPHHGGSEKDARALSAGRRAALKLQSMVNALLEVNRLEDRSVPLDLLPTSLRSLVSEVLEVQAPLAASRSVVLRNDVPDDLPKAKADEPHLSRVVQNLVGNAIKFTPPGGEVRVHARHDPETPDLLRVEVEDTGDGVPDEIRDRIFEKFVTGRQAGRGMGLGLAFCRLAVEAHGGRIRVENRPGGGARFVFTVPHEGPVA